MRKIPITMSFFGFFGKKSSVNPDDEAILDVIHDIENVMHQEVRGYDDKIIEEFLKNPIKVSFGEGYDHSIRVNGRLLLDTIDIAKYLSFNKKFESSIEFLSNVNIRVSEGLENQSVICSNGISLTRFYTEMAEAYYSLGKYNEARESLKIAFEVNKKYLWCRKGWEAAQEELERACRCASLVSFKMADYKNSIKYSNQEIKVGEGYCPWGIAHLPRLLIGISYLLRGNSRKAKKYFREVEKIAPASADKKRSTINTLLALAER